MAIAVVAPESLTLRCYGVGFGDCFLLTFHYPGRTGDRHMLIDCGSTQRPPHAKRNYMGAIVKDIQATVGEGSLHVLVATHRHAGHINGFATRPGGRGTGDRLAKLNPRLVIQPWTEDSRAGTDAQTQRVDALGAIASHRETLQRMHAVTTASLRELRALRPTLPKALASEVAFLGVEGLSSASALKNLAKMGTRKGSEAAYVHAGARVPALRTLIPGVQIDILGPPTIAQQAELAKQFARSGANAIGERWRAAYAEFTRNWQLRADTSALIPTASGTTSPLFPNADSVTFDKVPIEDRWFVRRVRNIRGRQLLGVVRAVDDALNNSSVILLIRAGGKKLLFPGDARWDSWSYALARFGDDLRDVDVYKVGHHGSLDATPKALWNLFARRSARKTDPARLMTILSTRTDSRHGHRDTGTEVPRDKLVRALRKSSTLCSTQELEASGDLVLTLTFDVQH